MIRKAKKLKVELRTATGPVFSGQVNAVGLQTGDGLIAIDPREESYLNFSRTTEITLREGNTFRTFVLSNATASLRNGKLTVLAEGITPPAAIPIENIDPEI
jgi:F0F1-type ATP synthase epsilon subunit